MDKLKKIITHQSFLNAVAAVCGIILTCCYLYEDKPILAICWAAITGSDIGLAWLHRKDS